MFLHLLNPSQQEAFLSLALELVEIDGDFSASEKAHLERFFAETKLPFSLSAIEKATPKTRPLLLERFTSQQAKVCLLLELIGLGYADGNYCESEQAMIADLARGLGLHEAEVAQFQDWVKRFFLLFQEATFFW